MYDGVAAHTLFCLAKEDNKAMELASKLLEQRRRMSAVFISEVPIQIDRVVKKNLEGDDPHEEDTEARIGMHTHNMLFTNAKGKKYSVVGELLKLKPTVDKTEDNEYSVSISISSKYDDVAGRLSSFERLQLDSKTENAAMQLLAIGAMDLAQVGK